MADAVILKFNKYYNAECGLDFKEDESETIQILKAKAAKIMRKILLLLVLTLSFGAFLHADAHTTQKVSVLINKQKTVVKNKLTIKFVSLVEDSRCPTDVQCIQAGNAKITIEVCGGKSAAKTFEINTNLQPQTVSYGGYEIKLTDLNPKPASNIRINRNGYTATFAVYKAGKSK